MHLNNVFGVSRDPVASYIERDSVDSTLSEALATTKQIVIYGSSKQGKTALLQRHLDEKYRCTYHCGPASSAEDIYRAFLRQLGVEIVTEKANTSSKEATASVKAHSLLSSRSYPKGRLRLMQKEKWGKNFKLPLNQSSLI